MTSILRTSFDLRRPFCALLLFVMPLWAHEGHESEGPAAAEHAAAAEAAENPENPSEFSGAEDDEASILAPGSRLYRTIKYAGKFHVMFIHFPIAFLLGATAAQWFVVVRKKDGTVVRVLLWCGAIGAVVAAALGWMYAYDSVYFGDDAELLSWHRWLGTSTALTSLLVLVFRRQLGPVPLAISLTVCAGLVAAAGHYGASLVYGPEFLLEF